MSFVGATGPQDRPNVGIVCHAASATTRDSGRVTSTRVHVSLFGFGFWTFPAQSVAIARYSYVWASAPVKSAVSAVVNGIQSVQAPPSSRTWMRYEAMSSDSGAQRTGNVRVVCQEGSETTKENGRAVSTIVHVSLPATTSRFPAKSVAIERNW